MTYFLDMKTVQEFIEELKELPPTMAIYHFDMKSRFCFPKVEIAETKLDGEDFQYVMISSGDEETKTQLDTAENDLRE